MIVNLDRNLKSKLDNINKNFKIVLDSLRKNRAILKNLEEKLDFIKDQSIVKLDEIQRIEEERLKLKQLENTKNPEVISTSKLEDLIGRFEKIKIKHRYNKPST